MRERERERWGLQNSDLEDIHVEASSILPGKQTVVVVHLIAGGSVVVGNVATGALGLPAVQIL